jgi:hypothetical protein
LRISNKGEICKEIKKILRKNEIQDFVKKNDIDVKIFHCGDYSFYCIINSTLVAFNHVVSSRAVRPNRNKAINSNFGTILLSNIITSFLTQFLLQIQHQLHRLLHKNSQHLYQLQFLILPPIFAPSSFPTSISTSDPTSTSSSASQQQIYQQKAVNQLLRSNLSSE